MTFYGLWAWMELLWICNWPDLWSVKIMWNDIIRIRKVSQRKWRLYLKRNSLCDGEHYYGFYTSSVCVCVCVCALYILLHRAPHITPHSSTYWEWRMAHKQPLSWSRYRDLSNIPMTVSSLRIHHDPDSSVLTDYRLFPCVLVYRRR